VLMTERFLGTRGEVDVGGGDEGSVGQHLQARVAAVVARVALKQLDAVLAPSTCNDVFVGSDPGDILPSSQSLLFLALSCLIAHCDHPTAIWRIAGDVAVAGQRRRQFLGVATD